MFEYVFSQKIGCGVLLDTRKHIEWSNSLNCPQAKHETNILSLEEKKNNARSRDLNVKVRYTWEREKQLVPSDNGCGNSSSSNIVGGSVQIINGFCYSRQILARNNKAV